jgi:hypothetical protein
MVPVMTPRWISLVASAVGLLAPQTAAAQEPTQVTLNVPVNLTRLSPDISKLRLACGIRSDAIATRDHIVGVTQEVPTSGGQINATIPVVISIASLDDPTGKLATVRCTLEGWSALEERWAPFGPLQASPFKTDVALGISETTFTW